MNKDYFKEYYHLERKHWWFTARAEILENRVKNLLNGQAEPKILNAGVATGATSEMLGKYGHVHSLEFDKDCCEFLESELKMEVVNGSLTQLPFEDNSFDLVCAFDVIEHIEDDQTAVNEVYRVLKPGGKYCLTVPAFQFLWSEHDEINHHFRRYSKDRYLKLFRNSNLQIDYSSYFNFWLFAPIAVARLMSKLIRGKRNKNSPQSDFSKMKGNSLTDRVFFSIFRSEIGLLNAGVKLPFGVSIIAEGRKSNH